MSYLSLSVTAPHTTAYDGDYPTRSSENYSHQLHSILQDMEDVTGSWYLYDDVIDATDRNELLEDMHDNIEAVFDYADGAITTYRATGTPTLSKPLWNDLIKPSKFTHHQWELAQLRCWDDCVRMKWKIYYMWKTEDDPLLLKEKLQELLIAWPLTDLTVTLSDELGQQFKVYPSWKNADLDL